MRYVRVYVRQARAGTISMGNREVFVTNGDGAFPEVYYLADGSISYLTPEDFESACDRVITQSMAKSILRVLDSRKPSTDVKTQDVELEIRRYVTKILSTKQRVRRRERQEITDAKPRVRTRNRAVEEQPKTRKRVRRRA